MAEVPRTPLGRSSAGSWLPGATAIVLGVLVLVVLKPWAPPAPASVATPPPTFYIAPVATERTGPRPYDPRLFGGREPDPAWELWPAGYVVMFGIAGPVKVEDEAGATGRPGASVPGSATAPTSPGASEPGPTVAPLVPGLVDLGPADHLVALGINTPLDARVTSVMLWFYPGDECCAEALEIVRLPTLWDSSHFIVIAPADSNGAAAAWLVGRYRLDVTTAAGEIREVNFAVRPPLD